MIVNLLSNAVKFCKAEGAIVLQVQFQAEEAAGTRINFCVSDTGIRIPKEKQKLIFEAFTQADSSTTRQFGGTGLGLTISQKLVKLLGGELSVRSAPNQGSVFFFDCLLKTPQRNTSLEKNIPDVKAAET